MSASPPLTSRDEGVAFRATFIVDPDNVIQHVTVNGLNVGRNPQETLRILDALQTDELCPCNWQEGQEPLRPAA
jgi:peroxiredoxin (alkyl hydroperoxide reductase subunit C)